MAGNAEGNRKAHKTTLKRHGAEFIEERSRKGGKASRTGGFAANPKLASEAAKKSWQNRRKKA